MKIVEDNESEISIEWSDGTRSSFKAADLRRTCPCAGCVDEWTGQKTLDAKTIPDDLRIEHTSLVGRYALNFHFSDGHDTGIFSFNYLKGLK